MNHKIVTPIGNITNEDRHTLLKMWNVDISSGTRPVIKHRHLNFEITMVDSGSGIYMTDRERYVISKGDVFVFPSNEQHCITAVGNDRLSFTNLQFDPQFIQNSRFCFQHNPEFQNRIKADTAAELIQLLRLIREELLTQSEEYVLSIKSYLHLLLVKLVRGFEYLDKNPVNAEQFSHIHCALVYIDEHFTEQITLQEISSLAGLTSNYLCALFKQISGMTLWDYIGAKRINRAVQLLTMDNCHMNILDIATQCGYNSTANFNKSFKKITGMTPSEYRANRHILIS